MKCHSDPMIIFFRFLSCSKLKEIFSKPRIDLTLIFDAVFVKIKNKIQKNLPWKTGLDQTTKLLNQ